MLQLILRLILFLVITFSCKNIVWAQSECNLHVHGHIYGHEQKRPISAASILILPIKQWALSDSKGNFEFKNLCADTFELQFSSLGFKSTKTTLVVNETGHYDFYMHNDTCVLEDIQVVGQKLGWAQTEVSNTVDLKILDQKLGASLADVLKTLPGVYTLQSGPNIQKPLMHGLFGTRLPIFQFGMRQEGQNWGNEHAPEIDPSSGQQISAIKGAAAVLYGTDATGGLIKLEPIPIEKKNGLFGNFSNGFQTNGRLFVSNALVEIRNSKIPWIGFRAQGTLKKGGDNHTPSYNLGNTGVEEGNFSAYITADKGKWSMKTFYAQFHTRLAVLKVAHIGNLADLNRALQSSKPLEIFDFSYGIERPYQQVEHEFWTSKIAYKTNIGEFVVSYARQFNGRDEYDRHLPRNDALAARALPEFSLGLTSHAAELLFEQKAHGHWKNISGVKFEQQKNTTRGRYFIPPYDLENFSVYTFEKYQIDKWFFEVGGRFETRNLSATVPLNFRINELKTESFPMMAFSLGTTYRVTDDFLFKTNVASTMRAPNISELYAAGLHHGSAALEYGNENMQTENGYKWILSLEKNGEKFRWNVMPYVHYFSNYIFLAPSFPAQLTIRGAFPVFKYEQAQVALAGIDGALEWNFNKKWTVHTQLSIIRGQNLSTNEALIFIPADRIEGVLTYHLPHSKRFIETNIGWRQTLVAQQYRVPSTGDYAPAPEGYFISGLLVSSKMKVQNQWWTWNFSVDNIFNQEYRDYLNRFRYFIAELGTNVSLRLKIPIYLPSKSN